MAASRASAGARKTSCAKPRCAALDASPVSARSRDRRIGAILVAFSRPQRLSGYAQVADTFHFQCFFRGSPAFPSAVLAVCPAGRVHAHLRGPQRPSSSCEPFSEPVPSLRLPRSRLVAPAPLLPRPHPPPPRTPTKRG